MSFSNQVKEELLEEMGKARHCQMAELAALICYNGRIFSKEGSTFLAFDTENQKLLKKYFTLLNKTISINECGKVLKDDDARQVLEMVKMLGPDVELGICTDRVDTRLISQTCCKRAYVRGAFLSSGSISDPNKAYHFEIVCTSENQSAQLVKILKDFGIKARTSNRKAHDVVYLKDGEEIVEALNVMGAGISLMNYENVRILKDMRNSVNRKVNCETANISKTIKTAVKQIEDIELIQRTIGLDALPENLQEMARVRVEYEDVPLKDLGSYLAKPIGKSGVNHRLAKISEIAEDIRLKN